MALNIITDDFEQFYEIQDDLGRFVDNFLLFFASREVMFFCL